MSRDHGNGRGGAHGPEAARRTRAALLSFVRHELRTPVNAVIGYSEMLIEDAAALGRPDLAPDLGKLLESGQLLLALINEAVDAESRQGSRPTDLAAFAADMQYRLRVPLNTVIGYSDLLAEEAAGLGEEFVSDIRKVGTAGRRLLALADDIVNFRARDLDGPQIDPAVEQRLELDRLRQAVDSMHATAAPDCEARHSGRLLIADDNEFNRDLLSRHLEREGHEVACARDGAEALRMLGAADCPFDLLLLDIMMPEMNGFQVLERLKADPRLRSLPVIVVSALGESDGIIRCIEMGAEDYLSKPCDQVLLRARVGACLEKKRLRDQEQLLLEQVRAEREKSERLLLNVLPQVIADRLRDGPSLIAERFDEATVVFADIVGFTEWSSRIPADEVVLVLNDLFSLFDALTERHGLEKIKTIGDCYMAAAGLPLPRPDHAEAVAEMALDMQAEIAEFNRAKGSALTIRTGVHTGPVVAGVVGTRKFIYDLWGDTVNTASRMESHGLPGQIQVTGETRARLDGGYLFEPRGEIKVRGKGAMSTYFLTGRKPRSS